MSEIELLRSTLATIIIPITIVIVVLLGLMLINRTLSRDEKELPCGGSTACWFAFFALLVFFLSLITGILLVPSGVP